MERLQEHDFESEHRAGSSHRNADALSARTTVGTTTGSRREVKQLDIQCPSQIINEVNKSELTKKSGRLEIYSRIEESGCETKLEICCASYSRCEIALGSFRFFGARKWFVEASIGRQSGNEQETAGSLA